MLKLIKFLYKLMIFPFVFNNSLTSNLNYNSINITEISSYLEYFKNEIFLIKSPQQTVVKSVRHKEAAYFFNELLDEYSKGLDNIKILLKDTNNHYKHSFDYVNVIFIDSYESFRKIDPGPISATKDYNEYNVIIYYSMSKNPEIEIQKIFDYCWQFYNINVALLLKTEGDRPIDLYTYYPFTQNSCKNPEMRIVNQQKSILELKASEIFPNKFKKFYNCTLMAALWNVPPYLMLPTPGDVTKKMSGIEGYLLNELAEALDFKIDIVAPPNNEQRGLAKANGVLTGALKMLDDRSADLSLGSFRCTLERSTILSPSNTFYQTTQVFTVLALHNPFSGWETIFFPFGTHIWIVLMALVIFLLSSPIILKFYFPNTLRFIYGFNSIYRININTVAITLNQPTVRLPRRNFARYIVMMWILLTMILRSIYQGGLYDLLKKQQILPPPNTLKDLIQSGYTLIVNVATNDSFSQVPSIRGKLLKVFIMNITDSGGFPLLEANPDKLYVTGTPRDFLTYYVNAHKKNGVFHVLKEAVFTQHLCVYFTKHSFLVKAFDQILQNLRNFGLIDYWASQLLDDRFLERVHETSTEPSLTLTQLLGIVEISLWLYFLTIVTFLCEIAWFKIKRNK